MQNAGGRTWITQVALAALADVGMQRPSLVVRFSKIRRAERAAHGPRRGEVLLHVPRHTKGELVDVRVCALADSREASYFGFGHTAWLHGDDLGALSRT